MKKSALILVASLLCCVSAGAQRQDSLKRELTVVSDATIAVEKAEPLNPGYIYDKPKVTRLKPTPPKPTGDFTPHITIPRHPALSDHATRIMTPKKIGYVSLLGGMGPTAKVDGGLLLPLHGGTDLYIDASHCTTLNKVRVKPDLQTDNRRFTTDVAIGLRHIDASNLWQIDGYFSHDRYSFYAVDKNSNDIPSDRLASVPSADEFIAGSKALYKYDADSYLLDVNAELEIVNKSGVKAETFHWDPFCYNTQLFVAGDVKYTYRLADQFRIGMCAHVGAIKDKSSFGSVISLLGPYEKNSSDAFSAHIETVTPFVGIEGMIGSLPWNIDLGASVGLYSFTSNDPRLASFPMGHRFVWYPFLDGKLSINKDLSLFAKVSGGMHRPDRYGDDLYNRYIALGETLLPEHERIHSSVGVAFNAGAGIEGKISGGYDLLDNKNFVRFAYGNNTTTDIPPVLFFVRESQRHLSRIFVDATIRYNLFKKVELDAGATYHKYLVKEGVASGYLPLLFRASILVRANEKLNFTSQLFAGALANTYPDASLPDQQEFMIKPLSVLRLDVGANYRLNSLVAFHATVGTPSFFPNEFPYGYSDSYILRFNLGASVIF